MAKIKIQNFIGLNTYPDENSIKLEEWTDCYNVHIEPGKVRFKSNTLTEFTIPALTSGWTWEKGSYAILANDKLAQNPVPAEYEILVLIAYKDDSGTYRRRIIFTYKTGNSWSGVWYQCQKETITESTATKLPSCIMSNTFLDTTIVGTPKIVNDKGIVKIYLPHEAFWLGRLDRKIYRGEGGSFLTIDDFYFDTLVDEGGNNKSSVVIANPNTPSKDNVFCLPSNRIGIYYTVSVDSVGGTTAKYYYIQFVHIKSEEIDPGEYDSSEFSIAGTYKLAYFKAFDEYSNAEYYIPAGYSGADDTSQWVFYLYYDSGLSEFTDILIPENFIDSGTVMQPTSSFSKIINPTYTKTGGYLVGNYYRVPLTNFIAEDEWKAGQTITISGNGFSAEKVIKKIIVTGILDEVTEIILDRRRVNLTAANEFAIEFNNLFIPVDVNLRLTGIKIYLKAEDDLDYELYRFIQLANELEIVTYRTTYCLPQDAQGIYLAQNIGYYVDDNSPGDYSVMKSIKDIVEERGFAIAINSYDKLRLHPCIVGGGKIQTDLFYESNVIETSGLSYLTALSSLPGKILAHTRTNTMLIAVESYQGVPNFRVYDAIEYGVKNKDDIVMTKNIVIMNTATGIYLTNGNETKLLSGKIKDITDANYATSKIYYNDVKHELFYKPTSADDLYRYRFETGEWDKIDATYLS